MRVHAIALLPVLWLGCHLDLKAADYCEIDHDCNSYPYPFDSECMFNRCLAGNHCGEPTARPGAPDRCYAEQDTGVDDTGTEPEDSGEDTADAEETSADATDAADAPSEADGD